MFLSKKKNIDKIIIMYNKKIYGMKKRTFFSFCLFYFNKKSEGVEQTSFGNFLKKKKKIK
jgi:hypothetical protein